ncbi:hypothetical protein OPT61_g5351 [Boeremia exigua]|uniref:Uncharacterized protein n=1 Tax=Boeremia exigua TaxID=749465 RepID=A0ACC2IAM6_9PLEO|nr:hypothetical protein OPT61_g5351 [Boeremia exigua]
MFSSSPLAACSRATIDTPKPQCSFPSDHEPSAPGVFVFMMLEKVCTTLRDYGATAPWTATMLPTLGGNLITLTLYYAKGDVSGMRSQDIRDIQASCACEYHDGPTETAITSEAIKVRSMTYMIEHTSAQLRNKVVQLRSIQHPPSPTQSTMHIHDVLIIGAGPAGLAAAARLREHTPSATFTDDEHQRYHWIRKHGRKMNVKNYKTNQDSLPPSRTASETSDCGCNCDTAFRDRSIDMLVLDADGADWMSKWNRLFKTFGINYLRSPMFFQIDPADRDALLGYAYEQGREKELQALPGCAGKEISKHRKKKKINSRGRFPGSGPDVDERDRKDYFTPSTSLFTSHCEEVIRRYGLGPELLRQERVMDIRYEEASSFADAEHDSVISDDASIDDRKIFCVKTNKAEHFANVVILAVGPGNAPSIPSIPGLLPSPHEGYTHAMQIKHFPPPHVTAKIAAHRSTNLLIVGGGLTSVQLADLALKRGVTKVHLLLRGPLKVKYFDVDLDWVGKFRNFNQAAFWSADTDEERFAMINQARNGGSMTPRYRKILDAHVARGRVVLHTHTTLDSVAWDANLQCWKDVRVSTSTVLPDIDHIVFATGIASDIRSIPFLDSLRAQHPVACVGGLPCLTDDLMWSDSVPLFVTGRLAGLRLGPGAPNLVGARVGAERIAWNIEDELEKLGKLRKGGKRRDSGYQGSDTDGEYERILSPPRSSPSSFSRIINRHNLAHTTPDPFKMKRQRVSNACHRCRHRKLGCNEPRPCHPCIRAGVKCERDGEEVAQISTAQSAVVDTTPSQHDRAHLLEFTVLDLARLMLADTPDKNQNASALPGGNDTITEKVCPDHVSISAGKRWSSFMAIPMPSRQHLDTLIDGFFARVDWFMMTVPQSIFRMRCERIFTVGVVPQGEENFARLIVLVLAISAFYDSLEQPAPSSTVNKDLAPTLLRQTEQSFLDIINVPGIEAIQICTILGSFHLFNGRPNSGFGILGSAIKLAQNLGMHRQGLFRGSSDYEVKSWTRSWWALEVFDKYAAVAFGRPCAIDDSDCDVDIVKDDPQGSSSPYHFSLSGESVSLVSYHQHKFQLYRIMGPFLGRRIQTNRLESLATVHRKLAHWWDNLPWFLQLSKITAPCSTSNVNLLSLLRLQALSLQLAFDNLQIALHRWVLYDKRDRSQKKRPAEHQLSFSQLTESALRTSSLDTEQNISILRRLQSSHAAMHAGLCFFTAGVVLCAIMLHNPSAEQGHKARRGIRSIIELHRLDVVKNHILTAQSVKFLEQLVDRITSADKDFLLGRDTAQGPPPPRDDLQYLSGTTPKDLGTQVVAEQNTTSEDQTTQSSDAVGILNEWNAEQFAETVLQDELDILDPTQWWLSMLEPAHDH